jgi:hypothetical protein
MYYIAYNIGGGIVENYKMNPIKQNLRVKQFLGWFLAVIFPFAARGIMDVTEKPILSIVVYLGVCGILLRYVMEKKLPYFKPQFLKVKKEIILFILATILCGYLYVNGYSGCPVNAKQLILNIFIFAILNGSFEHLVWINIFDLAGCKVKIGGVFATFTYVVLINALFWSRFLPEPKSNMSLFIIGQGLMLFIPLVIYMKTKDITIWSIQHIIYNLIGVIFANFGVGVFFIISK